jgi:hypothetical protein
MKTILAALLLATPLFQDVEAKKTRVGEILKAIAQAKKEAGGIKAKEAEAQRKLMPQMQELQKLIQEIAGPDREKQSALFQELMEKYVPEEAAGERVASNERIASAALMWIGTAQAEFRAYDPDGDGVANFWVEDISGLHRLRKKNGKAADLVEDRIARADARPTLALDAEGAPSKAEGVYFLRTGAAEQRAGYLFVSIVSYEASDGKTIAYDSGGGRNATKYGACAYPSEYGKTGRTTFIKNEALKPSMWKKDTGGQPSNVFPADPRKEGWQPYE